MTKFDRRKVLVACSGLLAAPLIARRAGAEGTIAAPPAATLAGTPETQAAKGPSPQFSEALTKILAGQEAKEEKVTLDIPELVENGNIVPYKLNVEGADTTTEFGASETIKRLYLLSTLNPQALVATFHFTPLSGKPAVTGRMRLAGTQDVVAVAETSQGAFYIGRRNVEVIVAGCGIE